MKSKQPPTQPLKPGKLFVLAGSSGAGKTTLVQAVIASLNSQYGCQLSRVVTYTTKPPRAGEVAGRDYHYLSVPEFQAKITQNYFLEWSQAYGHYYGSPRSIESKLAQGESQILIIDQVGVLALYNTYNSYHSSYMSPLSSNLSSAFDSNITLLFSIIYIWIETDLAILEQRLRARATESEPYLQRRLNLAQQESQDRYAKLGHIFNYTILNNQGLSAAISDLERLFEQELELL